MSVGVTKDYKLKVRNLHSSHTLTRLSYTELVLELEHLKIETTLKTEMFANVMGEYEK
jgi:hypothetical protein